MSFTVIFWDGKLQTCIRYFCETTYAPFYWLQSFGITTFLAGVMVIAALFSEARLQNTQVLVNVLVEQLLPLIEKAPAPEIIPVKWLRP